MDAINLLALITPQASTSSHLPQGAQFSGDGWRCNQDGGCAIHQCAAYRRRHSGQMRGWASPRFLPFLLLVLHLCLCEAKSGARAFHSSVSSGTSFRSYSSCVRLASSIKLCFFMQHKLHATEFTHLRRALTGEVRVTC